MLSNHSVRCRVCIVLSRLLRARDLQSTVHGYRRVRTGDVFRLYLLVRRVYGVLCVYIALRIGGGASSLFKELIKGVRSVYYLLIFRGEHGVVRRFSSVYPSRYMEGLYSRGLLSTTFGLRYLRFASSARLPYSYLMGPRRIVFVCCRAAYQRVQSLRVTRRPFSASIVVLRVYFCDVCRFARVIE